MAIQRHGLELARPQPALAHPISTAPSLDGERLVRGQRRSRSIPLAPTLNPRPLADEDLSPPSAPG